MTLGLGLSNKLSLGGSRGSAKWRRSGPFGAVKVFYEDRSNYCTFRLKGSAAGSIGNNWCMILYKSSSGRFSIRVWDQDATLLATVTVSGGMAGLPAAIASNGALGPIVTMKITGTIDNDTVFSTGIGHADCSYFRGGRG